MEQSKKIYFISDVHLGMHPVDESLKREKVVLRWLNEVASDASEIWLLGDIFDYWFEYKRVVPRGHTRIIGKLAEYADRGVKIHLFTGNHDIWIFKYLPAEIGADLYTRPVIKKLDDTTFFLAHGDGLNKSDRGYLFLRAVFRNRFLQWCYARLHPNATVSFARWWSKQSRYSKDVSLPFLGEDKEEQILFAKEHSKTHPEVDIYLFGHRHVPYDIHFGKGKRVVCLGDWIHSYSYGVMDEKGFRLEKYF